MGYIYILASPRRSKPQALYPELFSKGKNNSIENSSLYSFAIYNDLQLISNHNDYAFATKLAETEVPKNEFTLYNKKKYDELWYKAGPQKVVVIAKQDNLAIETITLFSYLFCIFLIIVGIFWVINYVLGKGWKSLKSIQFSIRNQIHGTVIFISVLSFLIIE
ncbi:MAG: hypothetical protein IPP48_10960 [Chitinophagaceae bacterium]|nr:hypothetical protein [Chitinophagaceae bacterium]